MLISTYSSFLCIYDSLPTSFRFPSWNSLSLELRFELENTPPNSWGGEEEEGGGGGGNESINVVSLLWVDFFSFLLLWLIYFLCSLCFPL